MIVVLDYGMGNVGSIVNMLKKVGEEPTVATRGDQLGPAEKIVLPGVGLFDKAIENLTERNFIEPLNAAQASGKWILGVCLGMQLMTRKSEEGKLPGLGWVDAEVVRFQFDKLEKHLKVPHMRWNLAEPTKASPFFDFPRTREQRFYFIHSYYVRCGQQEDILTRTVHGHSFVSSFMRGNLIGVQFHPEKSHKFGIEFFKRFAELEPA